MSEQTPEAESPADLTFRDLIRAIVRLSNRLDDQDADLSAAEGRARAWQIESEANSAELGQANAYVGTLRDELATAQAATEQATTKLAKCRQDRTAATARVAQLEAQIVALGATPDPVPATGGA